MAMLQTCFANFHNTPYRQAKQESAIAKSVTVDNERRYQIVRSKSNVLHEVFRNRGRASPFQHETGKPEAKRIPLDVRKTNRGIRLCPSAKQ